MVPFLVLAQILPRQRGYKKNKPIPPHTATVTAPPIIAALLVDTRDAIDAFSKPAGLPPRLLPVTAVVKVVAEVIESSSDVVVEEAVPVIGSVMMLDIAGHVWDVVVVLIVGKCPVDAPLLIFADE